MENSILNSIFTKFLNNKSKKPKNNLIEKQNPVHFRRDLDSL